MSVLTDFKARFPGFDSDLADTYVPILEDVYRSYYNEEYSEDNAEIILNLLAHLVIVENGGIDGDGSEFEAVQLEASKSVDGVSVNYQAGAAASSARSEFFRTTRYGQRFLLLIAHRRGPMFL